MKEYEAISNRLAVLVHDQTGEILFEIVGENAFAVAKSATERAEWRTPYQDNAVTQAIAELGNARVNYSLYPCPGVPKCLLSGAYFCEVDREYAGAFSAPSLRFVEHYL